MKPLLTAIATTLLLTACDGSTDSESSFLPLSALAARAPSTPSSKTALTVDCTPQTGSFAVTATGFGPGATTTGDVLYKFYPCEKLAHLFLPALYGPSNAATFSAGPLPTFLIPATIPYQEHIVTGFDNGVEQAPIQIVLSAGSATMIYSRDGEISGWTPSGSKGVGLQVVTVFLD
jgi:hypothetical protein